jgi:hypothetical protein
VAENQNSTEKLEDVLDTLCTLAEDEGEISVADVQKTVGKRSFAPFLLICGLIVLSPVGGIPGVPTLFAVVVLLTAGQLLLGRDSFWLPKPIRQRSIGDKKLQRGVDKLMKPARVVDRFLKPRLTFLACGPATYGVALACVALASFMPILEAVPFAVAAPAAAITAFALALVAHDGLLVILGMIATAASLYLITNIMLF